MLCHGHTLGRHQWMSVVRGRPVARRRPSGARPERRAGSRGVVPAWRAWPCLCTMDVHGLFRLAALGRRPISI